MHVLACRKRGLKLVRGRAVGTIHYIILYYIIYLFTLHYHGKLQLALYIYIQCKLQFTMVM